MAISVLRRMVDNSLLSHLSSAAMKSSTSVDPTDHKKAKHKLKKFLSGRPTLQSIRDKGYIKGNAERRVQQERKPFTSTVQTERRRVYDHSNI